VVRIAGRTDKYVAAPVEVWARSHLLELLAEGPRAEAALKKSLTRAHDHLYSGLVEALLRTGRIHRHPPFTRGRSLLALDPPDVTAYVGAELDNLMNTLAAKGFAAAALKAAMLRHLGAPAPGAAAGGGVPAAGAGTPIAAERPPAEAVIEAMHRLEPRVNEGAAVSIARLRDVLSARCDKGAFDGAVLSLLKRGVLELQSHAWPARLSAEEKSLLIDNGQGGWFDSAALLRSRR
jgi:hypothetical protein